MFDKLKTFFSGLSYAWKYGDVLRNVTVTFRQFPGWDDSELLRLWIRPLLQNVSVLTVLTKTPIDDVIAAAAIHIIDNNNSWAAVYALAQLVRDGFGYEGALIPQCIGNDISVESIARDACPECPAVGLTALGIILYLLQRK
ncbi:MAG: hypothetical protein LBP87_00295 [Planctomycetaceae bacterium]|jgi:hypothetical protein|nr:hypothetical protein [Planctomycetaceae bacterium]